MTITKYVEGVGEVSGVCFTEVDPGTVLSRKDIKYGGRDTRVYYLVVVNERWEYRLMRLDNFEILVPSAWIEVPFEIIRSEITISDHNLKK